ncbi:MAG: hypothetical protein QM698_12150 [Micropepsaceae bacterium]
MPSHGHMRWVTIFLAAASCFFAILLLYEVTLNNRPILVALDPRFLVAQFGSSAILLGMSGAIFVLPVWLVIGKRMADRPGPWAALGAFGGSAMMLVAALYASTCKRGTELCPDDIAGQSGAYLLLAAVMGTAGAGAALAGLLAWRRTEPPPPGTRTDFRV